MAPKVDDAANLSRRRHGRRLFLARSGLCLLPLGALIATTWTAESAWSPNHPSAATRRRVELDPADRAGHSLAPVRQEGSLPGTIDLSALDGKNGLRINGVAVNDYAGSAVSGAGDVNGDGFDDILVGAYNTDPHGFGSGKSFVVYGHSALAPTLELSATNGKNGFFVNGIARGDKSGKGVSGAGDVNGDGFDDILIGAPGPLTDGNGWGQCFVVYGGAGVPKSIDLSELDGKRGFGVKGRTHSLGESVASAGDVNGDGFDDLLLASPPGDSFTGDDWGQTYVIYGGSAVPGTIDNSDLNGVNGFRLQPTGWSASSAGDVNGDGLDDLLIDEKAADHADVLYGASALPALITLPIVDPRRGFHVHGLGGNFGNAVSGAGDVNGDGFDDILIGAPSTDTHGMWSGQSHVVFGGSAMADTVEISALDGTNGFSINGISPRDRAGSEVSGAGDVNGDGFDDVLIAAFNASPHGEYSGQSYIVYGGSVVPAKVELSALDGVSGFMINGAAPGVFTGWSVSGAGDVNGDGFDDVVIGARRSDHLSGHYGGQAYVIFGRGERPPEQNNVYLPAATH